MRTASLFASSTLQSSEQPDEVERLRAMAAKLRQEAVSLEFQQKAAVAAASEKFFRKLDVDQNGSISVQELRQGLAKVFKTELPEQRARQLVQEFDVNGDGALQLEEFVGVDALRNRLDALMQADRDRERQQAKDAQAQTEAAQLKEAQLELVNDKPPTASDKIVSVLPYLFPLLDGLQFSRFFLMGHSENPLAITAAIAYALYRSIPFGGLISFFGLTFLSDNPKLNRLVRFNLQQAVFLDIFLFAPALVASLGTALLSRGGVVIPPEVVELSTDATFLALVGAIGYASVSSLLGIAPNRLPFVSERTEQRMISPEMFDVNGRFAPFDEDGNLKRPTRSDNGDNRDGTDDDNGESKN